MKRFTVAIAATLLSALLSVSAAATPLKVLTFNVGLLRVLGHDFVPTVKDRALVAPREIARFAAAESVDVVVLQEVWKKGQAGAIARELEPLGYDVRWPRRCTFVGRESGLLLAVRRPLKIAGSSFTRFGRSTFIDSMAKKGILSAIIVNASDSAKFALLATHTVPLDTDRGTPVDEAQVTAITGEAGMILAELEETSGNGALPALLVGDFNVGPGYVDAGYRLIADAPGVREAGASSSSGEAFITWDPANPLVRYGTYPNEPAAKIDHVFLRDGTTRGWSVTKASVVLAGPVAGLALVPPRGAQPVPIPLSDHYGFLAELDLAGLR